MQTFEPSVTFDQNLLAEINQPPTPIRPKILNSSSSRKMDNRSGSLGAGASINIEMPSSSR